MPLSTTSANTLIQDQVSSILVEPLQAASVVLSSGVRIFDSSEPLRIPRIVSSGSVQYVAEGAAIPDTYDVNFDEIPLMPSDRQGLKSITRYSNELLRASAVGLEAVLKTRLVADVAAKLDSELLGGTGAANSITGILEQPGVQTGDLDVTSPDSFMDGLALATAEEVTPSHWFINGADFIALRKTKDGDGRYLLESDLTRDAAHKLFGVPVVVTNKVPAGTAILADTSQIAVVRDIDPTITVLTERYAEFDQVGLRVTARYDVGLLNPAGVVILTTP